MDKEILERERNRLGQLMLETDPTDPKYNTYRSQLELVMRMENANDKELDKLNQQQLKLDNECKRIDLEMAKVDLEKRKLDFEERKFNLEEKKLDFQREDAEKKNQFEQDRLNVEKERLEAQKEESERKLNLEERELNEKARMSKGQAIWRLGEILVGEIVYVGGTALLIKTIGNVEAGSILPKSMMMFIKKPR